MVTNTVRVLLVEDNDHDAEIVKRILRKYESASFELDWVRSTTECVDRLSSDSFDLVLLDYSLPDEDGLSFLRRLTGATDMPPVIMLTGWGDGRIAAEAMRIGAYDYFPKNSIDSETLAHAIHSALERYYSRRNEQRLRDDLARLSVTDDLTGLYNKRHLAISLTKECRRARRYKHPLSCLMIDVDDFRSYNESLGHLKGDELLQRVASLIGASVRDSDVVARYGGDEFCVVLTETSSEGAWQIAERLRSDLAGLRIVLNGHSVSVTVSIGLFATHNPEQLEPAILLEHADRALRKAKSAGKNQVCEYKPPIPSSAEKDASSTVRG